MKRNKNDNTATELFEYYGQASVENWRAQDNRKRKWPYGLLNVGESFLAKIPHDNKKRAALVGSAKIWQANNNAMDHDFVTTKVYNGYLVKRIK